VIFLYGRVLWKAVQQRKRSASVNKWLLGILLGCLGGLAGFFVSGLVHYNLGDGEVALIFYLLMAIGVRTAESVAADDLNDAAEQQLRTRMAA
jgi:uncharacterized membrane protein HdeD (DUF308 family)